MPTPTDTPTRTATHTAEPTITATESPTATATQTAAGPPICGDGEQEGGEECDDGNTEDGDGCSDECRIEDEDDLGRQFCTLTQGAWGSPGGIGNGSGGLVTLHPEILPVAIGGPGQSTTVSTQSALIAYLPKGGSAAPLYTGERLFDTPASVVEDGGGVLAGQTMSLALSINLSETGGAFEDFTEWELPDRRFCTQKLLPGDDGLRGTDDDTLDTGAPIYQWELPDSVAVAGNTVTDLLNMANQYLRGGAAPPPINEVNEVLTTLNMAFDECRRIVECP